MWVFLIVKIFSVKNADDRINGLNDLNTYVDTKNSAIFMLGFVFYYEIYRLAGV